MHAGDVVRHVGEHGHHGHLVAASHRRHAVHTAPVGAAGTALACGEHAAEVHVQADVAGTRLARAAANARSICAGGVQQAYTIECAEYGAGAGVVIGPPGRARAAAASCSASSGEICSAGGQIVPGSSAKPSGQPGAERLALEHGAEGHARLRSGGRVGEHSDDRRDTQGQDTEPLHHPHPLVSVLRLLRFATVRDDTGRDSVLGCPV